MYCYLWEEVSQPDECKFGDRFVFDGKDYVEECKNRIRDSVGVRKDLFDDGQIEIVAMWDVSDIAKRVGRNHKGGKIDDYLRKFIGHRKGTTGDVHSLSGEVMKTKVNQLLNNLRQKLPDVSLSTKQYEIAEEIISAFKSGQRIVLADLCARFGKTICSAAVAVEMETDLVIVASYVKTVFTSFATDLTSFQQFAEYEHIDTGDADYQKQISNAISSGKKVFAYLSLAKGIYRQDRIDFLFDQAVSKMLIVDEADFGAHKSNQAIPLIEKVNDDVYTIIMTGTNADRAVTHWTIDTVINVTYPELIIQKKASIDA
jgi:hypothetical protein